MKPIGLKTDFHDISALSTVFSNPWEVVDSLLLDTATKRSILAAWASDAFSVASKPWLRQLPHCDKPILLSDILECLQALDDDDDPSPVESRSPRLPTLPVADAVAISAAA